MDAIDAFILSVLHDPTWREVLLGLLTQLGFPEDAQPGDGEEKQE